MVVCWTADSVVIVTEAVFVQRCRRQRKTTTLYFLVKIVMARTNKTKAPSPRQILSDQGVRRISGLAMRIGTWNVRSLFAAGKLDNAISEMHRMNLRILGLGFIIANTFFKLPKRRLYTWKSPADNKHRIVRNQIDYFIINKRFRNSLRSTKTYPGADISSDHSSVISSINIKLKAIKRTPSKQNIDPRRLKEETTYNNTKQMVNDNLKRVREDITSTESVDGKWDIIQDVIAEVGKENLKPAKEKRKPWMTDEILELMEKRRQYKTKEASKYKEVQKAIRRKIREAKEKWLSEKCIEIEELDKKYDSFNLHRKIKEMTGHRKSTHSHILKDSEGNIIGDTKEKIKEWTKYIQQLFHDNRADLTVNQTNETGPPIIKEEVIYAIRNSKGDKAMGPDEIPIELIKLIDEDVLDVVIDLFNSIYQTGTIPRQWLQSTFITIPKKPNATTCADHRTISLMSHILKVFLKIIHNRIFRTLET